MDILVDEVFVWFIVLTDELVSFAEVVFFIWKYIVFYLWN